MTDYLFAGDYKDLFLDILVIVTSILLYQLFWIGKGNQQKNSFALCSLMAFSVILCMSNPIFIVKGFQVDLRTLPLMICYLYAGNRSGLILLIIMFAFRYYLGGSGFYLTFIIYGLFVPFLIIVAKHYFKWSKIKKIFVATILISYHTLVIASVNYLYLNPVNPKLWISYTVIYAFATWLSLMIFENILENMLIREEMAQTEKLQVLSALAASIAHEVRNPLTVVRGFLQFIHTGGASPEKIKSYMELSIGEVDRAQNIITDYLSFAKLEPNQSETFEVKPQLTQVVNIMSSYALAQNISIEIMADNNLWISANPQKFIQALVNIVKNGIEAMPRSGKIIVQASQSGETILISIIDEGTKMTKEQIHNLGNPFYSLKEKGTGLGLMVTYRIIKSIGGKIKIESEKGRGTKFILQIPMAKVDHLIST